MAYDSVTFWYCGGEHINFTNVWYPSAPPALLAHDLCPQRKRTPLFYASEEGRVAIVDALLKAGADVNAADQVCIFVSRLLRLPSPFVCIVRKSTSILDQYSKYPPHLLYFP